MLIDTHCHFDAILHPGEVLLSNADFPAIIELINRAKLNNVSKFINVGCNTLESVNSLLLSEHFEDIYCSIGIHPTEFNKIDWKDGVAEIKKIYSNRSSKSKLVAIGEIGLDFYHKPFNIQSQQDGFIAQLEFALKNNLPTIIHCREAAEEMLHLLEPYFKDLRGVLHCFQQNQAVADKFIEHKFMLGIDGPIDYPKNTELRTICKNVGLSNLILETDSPFLPPQHLRGKKNEPANILFIAKCLAEIFETTIEEVSVKTTENATKLFGLNNF